MTTTLEVIVGGIHDYTTGSVLSGTTYNLSNRLEYYHIGNDGFGIPELERFFDSGPIQDGATDRGYLLRPRKIQLVLNLTSKTETIYWSLRSKLLEIFAPRDNPIVLKFTTPVRTYYIDCYTEGGLTFTSGDKQGYKGHRVSIQLVAPNPVFYSSVQNTILLNGVSGPVTTAFTYNGTYKTDPIFSLIGPFTAASIQYFKSASTGGTPDYKIDVTGTIATGDFLIIDTNTKTAKSLLGNIDYMSYISTSSDLLFPIETTINVPIKNFVVLASGVGATTRVTLVTETRYIGV